MLLRSYIFFFLIDTATTEIYTLSLHDALPIFGRKGRGDFLVVHHDVSFDGRCIERPRKIKHSQLVQFSRPRSEEHTSELQSLRHLVCRLLLEKKKESSVSDDGETEHSSRTENI